MKRERRLVLSAVVLLVVFRTAMFLFKPALDFDSDQAIVGLMGKHLSEGRAWPLFIYGQNYLLAVEAWLAAPMFLIFGVSVAALKLPMLLMNIAVGVLLIVLLERELGLRPVLGLVASLPFVLASPETSATLLKTLGGTVEPLLCVLLLWMTRRRPVWFGLIAGIGFLNRESTAYGIIALLTIEAAGGAWTRKVDRQILLRALRIAAEVWVVVQFLQPYASAAGPGTTGAGQNNPFNVFSRPCFGFFGVASALLLAGAAVGVWSKPREWQRYQFGLYLTLTGLLSAVMLAVGCGAAGTFRYDLLLVFAAVGVAGLFFAVQPRRWRLGVGVLLAWATLSAFGHGRIWSEFRSRSPVDDRMLIIGHLDVRGIRYATADYWAAYYITFITNERIIVASRDVQRILAYGGEVESHKAEAVHISRTNCTGGQLIIEGVYFCPPE